LWGTTLLISNANYINIHHFGKQKYLIGSNFVLEVFNGVYLLLMRKIEDFLYDDDYTHTYYIFSSHLKKSCVFKKRR